MRRKSGGMWEMISGCLARIGDADQQQPCQRGLLVDGHDGPADARMISAVTSTVAVIWTRNRIADVVGAAGALTSGISAVAFRR